jgi:hypothetical protein
MNESGEVIGIVVATISGGQNLNFAISASEIAVVVANGIAPLDEQKLDKEIKRDMCVGLIDRFMRATAEGKPIDLHPYVYTNMPITYWYGIDSCTPEKAMQAMALHYKQWPNQKTKYDINQAEFQALYSGCLVKLPFEWWASNGKKSIHGRSELEAHLWIDVGANEYRIGNIRNNPLP